MQSTPVELVVPASVQVPCTQVLMLWHALSVQQSASWPRSHLLRVRLSRGGYTEKVALETVATGWTHVVPWLQAELLFCVELRLRPSRGCGDHKPVGLQMHQLCMRGLGVGYQSGCGVH